MFRLFLLLIILIWCFLVQHFFISIFVDIHLKVPELCERIYTLFLLLIYSIGLLLRLWMDLWLLLHQLLGLCAEVTMMTDSEQLTPSQILRGCEFTTYGSHYFIIYCYNEFRSKVSSKQYYYYLIISRCNNPKHCSMPLGQGIKSPKSNRSPSKTLWELLGYRNGIHCNGDQLCSQH